MVEAATSLRPELPDRMADLYNRPERVTRVANELAPLQQLIKERTSH
jgi:threonine synthase